MFAVLGKSKYSRRSALLSNRRWLFSNCSDCQVAARCCGFSVQVTAGMVLASSHGRVCAGSIDKRENFFRRPRRPWQRGKQHVQLAVVQLGHAHLAARLQARGEVVERRGRPRWFSYGWPRIRGCPADVAAAVLECSVRVVAHRFPLSCPSSCRGSCWPRTARTCRLPSHLARGGPCAPSWPPWPRSLSG